MVLIVFYSKSDSEASPETDLAEPSMTLLRMRFKRSVFWMNRKAAQSRGVNSTHNYQIKKKYHVLKRKKSPHQRLIKCTSRGANLCRDHGVECTGGEGNAWSFLLQGEASG